MSTRTPKPAGERAPVAEQLGRLALGRPELGRLALGRVALGRVAPGRLAIAERASRVLVALRVL